MWLMLVAAAHADCQTPPSGPLFDPDLAFVPVPTDAVFRLFTYYEGLTEVALYDAEGAPVPGDWNYSRFAPRDVLAPESRYELVGIDYSGAVIDSVDLRTGAGPSGVEEPPQVDAIDWGGHDELTLSMCDGMSSTVEGRAVEVSGTLGDWSPLSQLVVMLKPAKRTPLYYGSGGSVAERAGGDFTFTYVAQRDAVCATPLVLDAAGVAHEGEEVCGEHHGVLGCSTTPGAGAVGALVLAAFARRRR